MASTTLEQIASIVNGRVVGDGNVPIGDARPVEIAGPGDITFISDDRVARALRTCPASAALVGPHFRMRAQGIAPNLPLVEVEDPLDAFVKVRTHLRGDSAPKWTGIHPKAYIAATAVIGKDVAIHPFAYVGEFSVIGDRTTLLPGVVINAHCILGEDCMIHANVVLYDETILADRVEIHAGTVLGSDGFGYRLKDGRHHKIPQTGTVEVANDVEIGANCSIDRGTFEATTIGEGTKIDNLVMIGHNNQIGRHNMICGQVGLAGSCKTGDYVVMAGQVGVKDHTEIGDQVLIGAQSGVHRNVPSGQQVLGSPALPIREQRRIFQMVARLPEMHKQLRELVSAMERIKLLAAQAGLSLAPLEVNPNEETA
ncbi:MAG: UDP-3-O-(3-hydroxymyristoyl)glucosamine N-acyltransferase [Planctomycetota bacterium]|nr:UDP-3-O-(3-hydroxymyristoyl)glucosamine N-acyltransferase [Planctomycetota bacterium]